MDRLIELTREKLQEHDNFAFGCSHTYGTGVEINETWAYKVGALNLGIESISADTVVRFMKEVIKTHVPKKIYVLWPDWTRFEIVKDGNYKSLLSSDSDYIKYMKDHNETWLRSNFAQRVNETKELCKNNNIKLQHMTLYDLIPYIDHADRWPISKLGHHYAPEWHNWVAELFLTVNEFPIAYD